jgi:hypothetical protein
VPPPPPPPHSVKSRRLNSKRSCVIYLCTPPCFLPHSYLLSIVSVFSTCFAVCRPHHERTGTNLSSNQFHPFWFLSPFGVAATVKCELRTVLTLPGYSNVHCNIWACYAFLSGADKYDQSCTPISYLEGSFES